MSLAIFRWVRSVVDEPDLTLAARGVALALIPLTNNTTGEVSGGVRALARGLGVNRRTLQRHLASLKEAGLITQEAGLITCTCVPAAYMPPCTSVPAAYMSPPLQPPYNELPIKRSPTDHTPKEEEAIGGGGEEVRGLEVALRGAVARLPTNSRPPLDRLEGGALCAPLAPGAMLALFADRCGCQFGEWLRGSSWQRHAPVWVAVVRHLATAEEWADLCADVAGKGDEDRARLPWMTKALNRSMRENDKRCPPGGAREVLRQPLPSPENKRQARIALAGILADIAKVTG